jgi:hypothetical protein
MSSSPWSRNTLYQVRKNSPVTAEKALPRRADGPASTSRKIPAIATIATAEPGEIFKNNFWEKF